jgi:hypothetical protein
VKNWIKPVHDMIQFLAFGNTVINLMVSSKQTVSFLIG